MSRATLWLAEALAVTAAVLLLTPEGALAHTAGDGAAPLHVLLELGRWGLGVLATLGLVTTIFWVRANWIRRHHS